MKRIILPFLIMILFSFGVVASEFENKVAERPDSIMVEDSLDLFRNITDISRQIERRTAQPGETHSVDIPPTPISALESTASIVPIDTTPGSGIRSIPSILEKRTVRCSCL